MYEQYTTTKAIRRRLNVFKFIFDHVLAHLSPSGHFLDLTPEIVAILEFDTVVKNTIFFVNSYSNEVEPLSQFVQTVTIESTPLSALAVDITSCYVFGVQE